MTQQPPPGYNPPPPAEQPSGGLPPSFAPPPPPAAAPPAYQGGYAPAPSGYAPPQAGGYPPAPSGYAPAPSAGYGPPAAGLVLPPGTELASAGKRIGGFLLEYVLLIVTLVIGYIIWTLIVWGRGQTPAKQVLGMRIYHLENQRAASWGQMFLRQFIGGIINSIFSIGLIVSFVFLFTDPQRRTVPDRIAGTVELNDPNKVLAKK